jgi:hypothetical protein
MSKGGKVFKAIDNNLKQYSNGLPENLIEKYFKKLEFLKTNYPNDSDLMLKVITYENKLMDKPIIKSRKEKINEILSKAIPIYQKLNLEELIHYLKPTNIKQLKQEKLFWIDPHNNKLTKINKNKHQIIINNQTTFYATEELPKNWLGSGIITTIKYPGKIFEFKPVELSERELVRIAHYSQKYFCPRITGMRGWLDQFKWTKYTNRQEYKHYFVLDFPNERNIEINKFNMEINMKNNQIKNKYKYDGDFFYFRIKNTSEGKIGIVDATINEQRKNILSYLRKI